MKSPRMIFEIRAQVDFLELLQSSALLQRSDKWTSAMERVRKLKFVDDAWIDHTCLISISTETARFDVARRRIESTMRKARRIILSY